MFSGDAINKKVKVLSGGEKTRLAMIKLLLDPVNVLILDEPTNHLDIVSKEILKDALESYTGTLVIVSHDRDFLDGLTDKVFYINNRELKVYYENEQLMESSSYLDDSLHGSSTGYYDNGNCSHQYQFENGKKIASHSFAIGTVRLINGRVKDDLWDDMKNWIKKQTKDFKKIDVIGSCVGSRGIRIQGISKHFNGEKIEILRWSPDFVEMINEVIEFEFIKLIMSRIVAAVPNSLLQGRSGSRSKSAKTRGLETQVTQSVGQ